MARFRYFLLTRSVLSRFSISPIQLVWLVVTLLSSSTWAPPLPAQADDSPLPLLPVPVIHFEKTEHDWGKVLQGSRVKHVFTVENRGRAPLKILKVTSTCGCTSTRFDEVIEPGASGIIELQVDTTDFSGGRPRKNAIVQTNDPESSEVHLWMVGLVDPLLKMESPVFKLTGLAMETKQIKTIILPAVDLPIEMVEARSKNKTFLVSSLEFLEEGWLLTLDAEVSTEIKSLRDDLELVISVAGDESLIIPVPVVIEHKDRIAMAPSGNVVFYRRHTAPLDGPVKRDVFQEVQIRSVREDLPIEDFSATMIDAPEGLFDLTVTELIAGHHYKVRIQVLRTLPISQARGTLQIRLGPGEDSIREKGVFAQFRLRTP
ncbi:MAG: DUF1573 domain-containing protein [Planctomycetota bacterium]